MKMVSEHEPFDFLGHLVTLDTQCGQLLRQAREHDAGSLGAEDHNSLLGECLEDLRPRLSPYVEPV
jgi:hypothetical protein